MKVDVSGATAPSGIKYVFVSWEKEDCIPLIDLSGAINDLVAALQVRGIPVGGKSGAEQIHANIRSLTHFPHASIAEAPGWIGDATYVLPTGRVVTSVDSRLHHIAFAASDRRYGVIGTLDQWQQDVVLPIKRWPAATFALMLSFLAPLLRLMPLVSNFAVEMVGMPAAHEDLLRQVAASFFGGTGVNGTAQHWRSIGSVVTELEDVILDSRDGLLLLDGTHLLAALYDRKEVAATKAAYLTLAFKVGRGDIACGERSGRSAGYRGGILLIGRDSVRTYAGKVVASGDDLITLHIPSSDQMTPDFGGAEGMEALSMAAAMNHGHAYPAFVEEVVRQMAKNRDRLVGFLEKSQAEFLEHVEANGDRAGRKTDRKIDRFFAAAYAAGRLGKEFGILPKSVSCKSAALECYRLFQAASISPKPFAERLEALIDNGSIIAVSSTKSEHQSKQAREALGTLWTTESHREVRIPHEKIGRAFPDWKSIWKDRDMRDLLMMDGKSLKRMSPLAPGMPPESVFRFKLELLDPTLFDDVDTAERR